ncbi:ABC transporter ATP-binding protein [Membranihabitans marinus]
MIAKNIHKSYGKLPVLKGVNLEINEGEILAIQGKSGAGKSTFLQILGSLDQPDSGEIIFQGQNIFNKSEKELAQFRNQHLGFIFQFHHLLDEFTAKENVAIPAMIEGKQSKIDFYKKAESLLHFMGLSERLEHFPNELSGGEQQRVAIARALINDPMLILADEPTGNLDTENSHQVFLLFKRLQQDFNQTIVVVTHDEVFAKKCDRIAYMKDGVIESITRNTAVVNPQ